MSDSGLFAARHSLRRGCLPSRTSPSVCEYLQSSLCPISAFKKACPFVEFAVRSAESRKRVPPAVLAGSLRTVEFNKKGGVRLSGGGGHATLQMPDKETRVCDFANANTPLLSLRQSGHQTGFNHFLHVSNRNFRMLNPPPGTRFNSPHHDVGQSHCLNASLIAILGF